MERRLNPLSPISVTVRLVAVRLRPQNLVPPRPDEARILRWPIESPCATLAETGLAWRFVISSSGGVGLKFGCECTTTSELETMSSGDYEQVRRRGD